MSKHSTLGCCDTHGLTVSGRLGLLIAAAANSVEADDGKIDSEVPLALQVWTTFSRPVAIAE